MRIDAPIITGSFSLNGDALIDLNVLTTTGSNTFIGNQSIIGAISASALTGSIDFTNLTNSPTLVSGSSQIVGILSPLNTFSASNGNESLNSYTSSQDTKNTTLGSYTGSNDTKWTSIGNLTGSYATTGSNTFYGTQVFSGSVFIATDLIVQGSSSIQYISASSVSIGTNIVNLNTATPSVRYAGISVQDSGSSAGVTGSMLWDSLCNRWIYSNPSTIGYSGGMLLSGPRASTLGTETTLTCNYIAKSGGGDHLYDSCIIDDGTTVCINANLKGSGTITGTTIYGSTAVCSAVGKFTSCIDAGSGTFSGCVSTGDMITIAISDISTGENKGLRLDNTGASGKAWNITSGQVGTNNSDFVVRNSTCHINNLILDGIIGAATFSSTITGTTIYASSNVCSAVGKFSTCIDAGSGTFSGQLNVIVPSGTAKMQIGNGSVTGGSYVNLMGVAAGKTWFVASNYNVGGALEFIQSTTNGGTTPSSTNIMTIQCTGNVGIGTCTPTDMIEVSSASSPRIKITNTTNSANAGIYFNVKDSGANALQGGVYYVPGTITYLTLSGDNVTSHLNVTRAGNVGIGCTTPGYVLDVRDGTTGSAGGRGMRLSVCSNSGGPQFRLEYQCSGDARNWLIGTNQEVSGDFIIRNSTIAGCDPGGASSAIRFSINKSGFVSIGGTDAGFKLDIQSPGCAGTAENVARIGNIPGTNNGLLVHRCTDNSYRYIFQSGIMCVQNTICTETMAPRFMQYNSRVLERVGGNNGTGTFSLFTNGIGTTQSSGTVFVEAIYGTPNTTGQWMYKIGGNRAIHLSWSNTTGYSGSEPSLTWYDSTLCIANSNGSVYFGVTVRLHDLGNGWAATWGNLPGLT